MGRPRRRQLPLVAPLPGWAVYLRTSSDESQKPELSRARQRFAIEANVLERSTMSVVDEYVDVLTGKTPNREGYQRLLADARAGKFSHVIVERADRFGRDDTEALRAIDELHKFGVAVRFANSPDLDPMDPDGRVIVALSFTLARRESALLGIRVKGGLLAKQKSGGFATYAPDGYLNLSKRSDIDKKKDLGRYENYVGIDTERAPIWRYAWDLLLEDKLTLCEIAEALHARGYRYRTGRPFVEIKNDGKRKPNIGTLSKIFHNWAYAGWVVSESNDIPPKTLKGSWDPIVSTEEFELGLEILERRNAHRTVRRTQEYLLVGLLYHKQPNGKLTRLTGSTSNASRPGGGTPYYRHARAGGISFSCSALDNAVAKEIARIQVNPELISTIESAFTRDLHANLSEGITQDRSQLLAALKSVDDEEARSLRLYVAGKITDEIWNSLWAEWQDRRNLIRQTLASMSLEQEQHVDNLATALQIIAKIGKLYNGLERKDQKDLLRQVVRRVVVDECGKVTLELKSPFEYLRNLADEVRSVRKKLSGNKVEKKNGGPLSAVSPRLRSNLISSGVPGEIRTPGPLLRRQMLYPLSYRHMMLVILAQRGRGVKAFLVRSRQ
jgi:DNA invertase Pin-like site-specific DNA recombinase